MSTGSELLQSDRVQTPPKRPTDASGKPNFTDGTVRQSAVSTDTGAIMEMVLASTVAAFGPLATGAVIDRISNAGTNLHLKALLVDILLDCGSSARVLDCLGDSLRDPEDWVRHNAIQALELKAAQLRSRSASWIERMKSLLNDPEPFVAYNAISALHYTISAASGAPQATAAAELHEDLAPLVTHPNDFVRWKARETMYRLRSDMTPPGGHARL